MFDERPRAAIVAEFVRMARASAPGTPSRDEAQDFFRQNLMRLPQGTPQSERESAFLRATLDVAQNVNGGQFQTDVTSAGALSAIKDPRVALTIYGAGIQENIITETPAQARHGQIHGLDI